MSIRMMGQLMGSVVVLLQLEVVMKMVVVAVEPTGVFGAADTIALTQTHRQPERIDVL